MSDLVDSFRYALLAQLKRMEEQGLVVRVPDDAVVTVIDDPMPAAAVDPDAWMPASVRAAVDEVRASAVPPRIKSGPMLVPLPPSPKGYRRMGFRLAVEILCDPGPHEVALRLARFQFITNTLNERVWWWVDE